MTSNEMNYDLHIWRSGSSWPYPGQGHTSVSRSQDEECFFFSATDAVDWLKNESIKVGKISYGTWREYEAVTTLCRFQCGVTEVCALQSAVALVDWCRVLCAKVVGATSSVGFWVTAERDWALCPYGQVPLCSGCCTNVNRPSKGQCTNHYITAAAVSVPPIIDRVEVLHPTRHQTGHFGDVLPSQSLGAVLKKLNPKQQKQTTQEQNSLS